MFFRVFSTFSRTEPLFRFFDFFEKKTDLEVFRFSTFLLFVFFLFFDLSRMRRTGPLFIFLKKSDVQVFQQFSIFYARGRFLFFRTFEQSSGRLAFLYFLSRTNLGFVVLVLCTLTTYFFLLLQRGKTILQVTLTWWFGLVVWKSGKSVFSKYFILK